MNDATDFPTTPTTLETVNDRGVVQRRKFLAFLTAAVNTGWISLDFSLECIASTPKGKFRFVWGSRTFNELRDLEFFIHPERRSRLRGQNIKTTSPRIKRKIAIMEDERDGYYNTNGAI